MDFLGKFKEACREIDGVKPAALGEEPKDDRVGPLYDIFKRTVTTEKNKAIWIGLPYHEAKKRVAELEAAEKKRREEIRNRQLDRGIAPHYEEIFYFDLVSQDKPEQRSLYYNARPLIIER